MAAPLRRLLLVRSPCPLLRGLSSVAKPLVHDQPSPFIRRIPAQGFPLPPPFPDASAGGSPSPSHHPPSFKAHPSFPHSFLSRIIDAPFSDGSDSGLVEGGGDPTTMWADSVKKKRKRKMNKHKYRKLRKRLRRKT